MGQFAADTTAASARAALWSWDESEGIITIRAEPGGRLSRLDGRWTLQALLEQLDGLARVAAAGEFPGRDFHSRPEVTMGKKGHKGGVARNFKKTGEK